MMRKLIPLLGKCLLNLGGILALVPAYAQTGAPYPMMLASGRTYKDYKYTQKASLGIKHDRDGELNKSFSKSLSRHLHRAKPSESVKTLAVLGLKENVSLSRETIFYYIAGKPIFSFKEDKALGKSLSTLTWMQENPEVFLSRLYNVREQDSEAEFFTQIFYELGEHRLSDNHLVQIERLWDFVSRNIHEYLEGQPGQAGYKVLVEVKGYSDAQEFYPGQTESDRKAWNERLSLNRARELAYQLEALLAKQFNQVDLHPQGKGEHLPPHLEGEDLLDDDKRRRMCQIRVRIFPNF